MLEVAMNAEIGQDLADGPDGMRISRAIEYLTDNFEMQPSLDDAAREAGLSRFYFQRIFTRFVGVSPKKFIQHLTLNRAKESLASSASVLDAAYDAGLSGSGRLHDLFVTHESLTPGEWKAKGAGKDISYGWHPSPFGACLIVASERGVCGLAFELEKGRDATIDDLFSSLGEARRKEDPSLTKEFADRTFDGGELNVVLRGTPFQLKVWEGLLRIPSGVVTSYEGLACSLGRPTAARAVASAVGRNPVSWLVPCHRILRGTGAITGYRWGPSKKRSMLAVEAAVREESATT
jgi:AraC family transcriptional regulator of adaptative response/methylated-DNA-[protein]-cysteine methyltransferase